MLIQNLKLCPELYICYVKSASNIILEYVFVIKLNLVIVVKRSNLADES